MASLIAMRPLGKAKMRNFRRLMMEAGDLEAKDRPRPYPRMQALSVPDIPEGKRFDTPTVYGKSSHLREDLP